MLMNKVTDVESSNWINSGVTQLLRTFHFNLVHCTQTQVWPLFADSLRDTNLTKKWQDIV